MAEQTAAADRGTLVVADRVVDVIASRAASGVPGVVRTPGRSGRAALPRVRSRQAGGRAILEVDVTLAWPRPAAATAADVRATVRDEVGRLAGVQADRVDVSVTGWAGPVDLGHRP